MPHLVHHRTQPQSLACVSAPDDTYCRWTPSLWRSGKKTSRACRDQTSFELIKSLTTRVRQQKFTWSASVLRVGTFLIDIFRIAIRTSSLEIANLKKRSQKNASKHQTNPRQQQQQQQQQQPKSTWLDIWHGGVFFGSSKGSLEAK